MSIKSVVYQDIEDVRFEAPAVYYAWLHAGIAGEYLIEADNGDKALAAVDGRGVITYRAGSREVFYAWLTASGFKPANTNKNQEV